MLANTFNDNDDTHMLQLIGWTEEHSALFVNGKAEEFVLMSTLIVLRISEMKSAAASRTVFHPGKSDEERAKVTGTISKPTCKHLSSRELQ